MIPATRGSSHCHWPLDVEVQRSISAASITTGIIKAPHSVPARIWRSRGSRLSLTRHFLPRSRTGEAFLHQGHRRRADSRRRRLRRGARRWDHHRHDRTSRTAHRPQRRISPLRFLRRTGRFFADVRMAPTERRDDLRAVDARRHQGSTVFSRSSGNLFEMYCPKLKRSGLLCSRGKTGWQLRYRL